MPNSHDPERLEALRKRLYDRGQSPEKRKRSVLPDEEIDVPTSWNQPPKKMATVMSAVKSVATTHKTSTPPTAPVATGADTVMDSVVVPTGKKRGYRIKMLLAGILFFIGAVIVSSLFLLWGGSAISGENISISLSGPFTIGGGEIIPLQVGITNQNNVSIDSATLIVEYPLGTQSAAEAGRELFVERLPLDSIASGETINVPLRAQVFGEENDELMVRASIEYRVAGSNATFFKDAEPLRFKIGSSPVVIDVDAVKKISSGQETDVTIVVRSNAPAPLTDILVSAEYPLGFDFSSALPSPDAGQNVWSIERLEPEEEVSITITGIVVGRETDEYGINFSVGVPSERDPFSLASTFGTARTPFAIEQPFLDVALAVNSERKSVAVVQKEKAASMSVEIKNTLEDAIYDGVITVAFSGNAVKGATIKTTNGFYDSNNQTITWDISSIPGLEQIAPGDTEQFPFSITPGTSVSQTPSITIDTDVKVRRALEGNASAELLGNLSTIVKVQSNVVVAAETSYSANGLEGAGPVPPKVGSNTVYTLSLQVQNGSNGLANGVVTATLPSHATWVGATSGEGNFSYNQSTREMQWNVGSVGANSAKTGSFQISVLPSNSQIDKTPTLLGEQRLKADDLFTQTVIRTSNSALTTTIPPERGYGEDNGRVKQR